MPRSGSQKFGLDMASPKASDFPQTGFFGVSFTRFTRHLPGDLQEFPSCSSKSLVLCRRLGQVALLKLLFSTFARKHTLTYIPSHRFSLCHFP